MVAMMIHDDDVSLSHNIDDSLQVIVSAPVAIPGAVLPILLTRLGSYHRYIQNPYCTHDPRPDLALRPATAPAPGSLVRDGRQSSARVKMDRNSPSVELEYW
jgi:hypothetical protein